MNASYVAIAREKNRDPSACPYLQRIEDAVRHLEEAGSTLGDRIRAGRAARGDRQVTLGRSEQILLAGLRQDEMRGQVEVAGQLQGLASAQEVIEALAFALENNLKADSSLARHCPNDERPLFQEILDLKAEALRSMQSYLSAHPADR